MIKEYREILGYMFARTTARTIYYHLTKKNKQVNKLYRKEKGRNRDIVLMNGLNYRTPLPLSMVSFLGTVRPNCITNIQINRSMTIPADIWMRFFLYDDFIKNS